MEYDYYAILKHLSGDMQVVNLKTHYLNTANKRLLKTVNGYDMTEDCVELHCLFRRKYDEDKGVYTAVYDEDYYSERTAEAETVQDLIEVIIADAFA